MMSQSSNSSFRIPKAQHHKAGGQAVIRLSGKDVSLGNLDPVQAALGHASRTATEIYAALNVGQAAKVAEVMG